MQAKRILVLMAILGLTLATTHPILLDEDWEAGYIKLDDKAELFYWLFRARSRDKAVPLVMWLQGGPGCSGLLDVFWDNGPYRMKESGDLQSNPFSWNNKADVLYIEQPIGTGFSNCSDPGRMPSYDEEAAKDVFTFMGRFVDKFPEYRRRDLYIAGHSYGGHFVPATAKYLLDHGSGYGSLKGIAVGNGWFSPYAQELTYPSFLLRRGLATDYIHYFGAHISYYISTLFIQLGFPRVGYLFSRMGDGVGKGIVSRFSANDVRQKCDEPPGCVPNITLMMNFIARDDFQQLIGVYPRKWFPCNDDLFNKMICGSSMTDTTPVMQSLLVQHPLLKVVLFTGTDDWICNIDGVTRFTEELKWAGQQEFKDGLWHGLYISGKQAGRSKKAKSLTFYEIYEAGHDVCKDQPEAAYEVLTDLISSAQAQS